MSVNVRIAQRILYSAILVVALIYTIVPLWGPQADMWETIAAMDAISESPLDPRNPLLDLPGETSPRFTPYTVLWGIVERLFDLPLFTTAALASLVNALLFFTGLHRVIRTITPDPRAPLWIIPVMLVGWGRGWGEANGYQFEQFFATMSYAGTFTYGLCFHGLAELNRYLSSGSRRGLGLYIVLGVLAFWSHPITALLLFAMGFAWSFARAPFKTAVLLQAAPFAALAACWLWPYFDYPTVLFRGSTEAWYRVRLFDGQLLRIGPVILGIFVATYYALRRRYNEVTLALLLALAIYLFSWALDIQIGSRFVFYGAIFAHICIGLFLMERFSDLRLGSILERGVVLFVLGAVFMAGGYYRVKKLDRDWQPVVEHYQSTGGDILEPWEDIRFLRDYLNDNSVVMVEDTVGWRIPAVTQARLVAQAKGNPLMAAEVAQRRADVVQFFSGPATTDERRELIVKYHCTHVLVDSRNLQRADAALDHDLALLTEPLTAAPPYRLLRVKP
ncbi:MAG: hypothetical protein IPK53_04525 [bacterium]|nr:hypothetical protein [bacterium]MBK8128223.1 hypothetical protein [bacterium]